MRTLFESLFESMARQLGRVDAIIMQEAEGETVAAYVREGLDPLDVEIAAAQWGIIWRMHNEVGMMSERLILVTSDTEVLFETLDPEFYLFILMPKDGPLGVALKILEHYLPAIHDEMGF